MLELHKIPSSPHARWFTIASLLVAGLFFAGGCKTSDDATAAASQLTATAKCLTDYYSALESVESEVDRLDNVEAVVIPVAVYDEKAKSLNADTRAELKKRAELASNLTKLAESFSSLSGSKAADEVSASATKLQTQLDTMKPIKKEISSDEFSAMKFAMTALTTAIKEHKEREAAKAINGFTGSLTALFVKEEPVYDSIAEDYAKSSKALALYLVDKDQTDPSDFLKIILDPYGLTPRLTDPATKARMKPLAEEQINEKADALEAAQKKANEDMEKALKEMASRIQTVADNKPMAVRIPPITLANVEKWTSQSTATPKTGSSASASSKTDSQN